MAYLFSKYRILYMHTKTHLNKLNNNIFAIKTEVCNYVKFDCNANLKSPTIINNDSYFINISYWNIYIDRKEICYSKNWLINIYKYVGFKYVSHIIEIIIISKITGECHFTLMEVVEMPARVVHFDMSH